MWVGDGDAYEEIEWDSLKWRVLQRYPDKILVEKFAGDFRVYANGVVADVKRSWDERNPFGGYELTGLRFPQKYLSQDHRIVVSWSQLIEQRDHPEIVSYERWKSDKEVWVTDEKADYLVFKDNLYRVAGGYTRDQQVMLVKSYYLKEDKKFQRLGKELEYFERFEAAEKGTREPIPEEVRIFAWRRDGGKCVKCGSQENLEFDHIIPLSKGGSNTERNVQILCQACNRRKADHI